MYYYNIDQDVKDREYFNRLKEYIEINSSQILEYNIKNYDVLLCDSTNKDVKSLIISTEKCDVYKYYKASIIVRGILNHIKDEEKSEVIVYDNPVKTICVSSALGGIGKTFISEKLAKHYSNSNKVLYINLNPFESLDSIFTSLESKDISKLSYYINKGVNPNNAIEKIKSYDHINKVYFINSQYPTIDGALSVENMVKFVKSIKNNKIYDYIIFDVPSYLTNANMKLLEGVNIILYLIKGDSERENIYLEYLKSKVKNTFLEVTINTDLVEIVRKIGEIYD